MKSLCDFIYEQVAKRIANIRLIFIMEEGRMTCSFQKRLDRFGDEIFAALNNRRMELEAQGMKIHNMSVGTRISRLRNISKSRSGSSYG